MPDYTASVALNYEGNAAEKIGDVRGALQGVVAEVMAFAGISLGFGEFIKSGIEFNQLLENTRLGIAGGILGTRQWTDANGELVTGQKAVDRALQESAGIQNEIREVAKTTVATVGQLAEAYQRTLPLAAKAGVKSQEDMLAITVEATQAMAGMGIPTANAAHELRGLFTGQAGMHFQFNQMLGITKEQIDKVRSAGGDVAQLFKDRMAPYAALASEGMKTLAGRLSNLKDAIDETASSATGGIFDQLKEGVTGLRNLLDESKAGFAGFGIFLGTVSRDAVESIKAAFGPVWSYFDSRVKESGGTWAEVWAGLALTWNNVWYFIRLVASDAMTAIMNPWDTFKAVVGGALSDVLGMMSEAASHLPGSGQLAKDLNDASLAIANWGATANKTVDGVTENRAKALAAWKTQENTILDGLAKIQAQSAVAGPKTSTAKPGEPDEAIAKAKEQWDLFAAKVRAGFDTAGLVGLDKALADVTKKYVDLNLEIDKNLAKAVKGGDSAAIADAARLRIEAENAKALDTSKVWADQQVKVQAVQDDVLKMWAEFYTSEGLVIQGGQATADMELQKGYDKSLELVRQGVIRTQAELETYWAALTAQRDSKNVKDVFAQITVEVDKLREALDRGTITATEFVRSMAALDEKKFLALGDGYGAAVAAWTGKLKSGAESIRDFYLETWDAIGKGFEDSVYNVISLKFSALGDVLKSIGDSILRAFSKMVTGMVQTWVTGQHQMNVLAPAGGGGGESGGYGANANSNWWTAAGGNQYGSGSGGGGDLGSLGAGVTGAGIGYGIGSNYDNPYRKWGATVGGAVGAVIGAAVLTGVLSGILSGTELGATIGTAVGPVGTVIGAIVGAVLGLLLGSLLMPNTEMRVPVTGATITKDKTNPLYGLLADTTGKTLGALTDLATQADPEAGKFIAKQMRDMVAEYLRTVSIVARAGSSEDLTKDLEYVLMTQIPREIMARLMGLQGMGEDKLPGISGATKYGGAFDADAPIPKMLAGLGVTAGKIQEIADRVNTEDIDVLLKWLQQFVGIIVSAEKLSDAISKTGAEQLKYLNDQASLTAVQKLRETVSSLQGRGGEIGNYTGQEQLDRAQTLVSDIQGAFDQMMTAVAEILQSINTFTSAVDGLLLATANAMKTPEQLAADLHSTAFGASAKVLAATTSGDAVAAANEGLAAFQALLQAALAWRQAAQQALETLDGFIAEMNGTAATYETVGSIQAGVGQALTMTGMDQVNQINKVGAAAHAMWQANEQSIKNLQALATQLHQSVQDYLFNLDLGEKDPTGKAGMLGGKLTDLFAALQKATSQEEIQKIMGDLQSYGSQYLGQFAADDPNRQAAVDWLKNLVGMSDQISQELIKGMQDTLKTADDQLLAALEQARTILSDNITAAGGAIWDLIHGPNGLLDLKVAFKDAMAGFADELTAAATPLKLELDAMLLTIRDVSAALGGTGAGSGAGGGGGDGDGLGPKTKAATANLGDFSTALINATTVLNGLAANAGGGGGGGNTTVAVVGGGGVSQADMNTIVGTVQQSMRRNPERWRAA